MDRNPDGSPELDRADSYLQEYYDQGEDGAWSTSHLASLGYVMFDRESDGVIDASREWDSDEWSSGESD